ncbi:MAG: MFS transporter, partial [Rhodoferax sp.]|nr:MFS transporter [Rhodoferax sp.]
MNRPLGLRNGLHYGLLGLPLAFCALPLYVLMPNMYAQQWGVPLASLGALLLGVRLLDALVDPLLGRWCDALFARSLTAVLRFGVAAAVLLALGFSLLMLPLPRAPDALLWWAGVSLVLTYLGYSALTLAHQSWGAMLGGDAVQRSQVVAWREGMGLAGVMLAAVAPSVGGIPALLVLLFAGLLIGCWMWARGPRPVRLSLPGATSGLWRVWRQSGFRRLMLVFLLNGIASAIPATLLLFFVQDRLQAGVALQSGALALYFACGALSLPLWLRQVGRIGLAHTWRRGMALAIVTFLGASLLGPGDALWFLLVCALSGAALGADLAVPAALLAGLIAKAGDSGQAEGAYFGWWNFASKLNLALAAGLALPLLAWLGYAPGARDAQALTWLTF